MCAGFSSPNSFSWSAVGAAVRYSVVLRPASAAASCAALPGSASDDDRCGQFPLARVLLQHEAAGHTDAGQLRSSANNFRSRYASGGRATRAETVFGKSSDPIHESGSAGPVASSASVTRGQPSSRTGTCRFTTSDFPSARVIVRAGASGSPSGRFSRVVMLTIVSGAADSAGYCVRSAPSTRRLLSFSSSSSTRPVSASSGFGFASRNQRSCWSSNFSPSGSPSSA